MPNFFRNIFVILLAVFFSACTHRTEPEAVLERYVYAVNEGRCEDAFVLLSKNSRDGLEMLRVRPQHPQSPLAIEQYYCQPLIFEDCKWGKMQLDSQAGDEAKVSMPCGHNRDSFLPGFSSPFLRYEPRVTDLVREDGAWRIVVPSVIRIVEIREREERVMEEVKRRNEEIRRKRGLPPPPPPPPIRQPIAVQ